MQRSVRVDGHRPVRAERAHRERRAGSDPGTQEVHRIGQFVGIAEHGVGGREERAVVLRGAVVVVHVDPDRSTAAGGERKQTTRFLCQIEDHDVGIRHRDAHLVRDRAVTGGRRGQVQRDALAGAGHQVQMAFGLLTRPPQRIHAGSGQRGPDPIARVVRSHEGVQRHRRREGGQTQRLARTRSAERLPARLGELHVRSRLGEPVQDDDRVPGRGTRDEDGRCAHRTRVMCPGSRRRSSRRAPRAPRPAGTTPLRH